MLLFSLMLKKVAKLIGFRAIVMISSSLLNLLLLRVLIQEFSMGQVGVYFVLIAFGQFISFLDLGIGYVTSILLSRASNLGKKLEIMKYALQKLVSAQFFFSFLLIAATPLWNLILFREFKFANLGIFLTIFFTSYIISLFNLCNQFCIVNSDLKTVLQIDLMRGILLFACSIISILIFKSIYSLIVAWTLSNLIPNLIFHWKLIRSIITNYSMIGAGKNQMNVLSKTGIQNQFTIIGALLNNSSDQIILSAILGPESVVSYQVVTRVLVFFKSILGIIWLQLWPILLTKQNDNKSLLQARVLVKVSICLGVLFLIFNAVLGEWFVRYFISPELDLNLVVYVSVGFIGLIASLEIVVSAATMDFIFQKLKLLTVLCSGILNVFLTIYLVSLFGVLGCFIASFIVITFSNIIPLSFVRREFLKNILK
jgi:O-antigen/teichoic acid export membrane protein